MIDLFNGRRNLKNFGSSSYQWWKAQLEKFWLKLLSMMEGATWKILAQALINKSGTLQTQYNLRNSFWNPLTSFSNRFFVLKKSFRKSWDEFTDLFFRRWASFWEVYFLVLGGSDLQGWAVVMLPWSKPYSGRHSLRGRGLLFCFVTYHTEFRWLHHILLVKVTEPKISSLEESHKQMWTRNNIYFTQQTNAENM